MERNKKEVTALSKVFDLLLWMIPELEKLPRNQKFLLGDRIESGLLDIMDLLIRAVYTRNRVPLLREANLKIESLRYLIRLVKELKYFSIKKYEFAFRSLDTIGREVGGWLKSQPSPGQSR